MSREYLKAIVRNDIDMIDSLINQGFDIFDKTKKENWNILHRSLMSIRLTPKISTFEHLIRKGINTNDIDVYGNTPLHYAVRAKRADIIKSLIDNGAKVNIINKEGVSPLREAFSSLPFDYDSIKTLIENGADIDQKNENGSSIKDLAQKVAYQSDEILKLFP
ncbi:ankyrin repeat domain-containing protein [Gallaecimonas pentaromativorans]|uniref:Ankyrin repeat protein n=1 Tax=Gallaecimonas pentaromativorans TaxID=584787 RepID=A0A3N1PWC8_9GAMM|nr:ankyrin repeat domain-containing protein [Gallaecimonas pentaromativorans]ROQ28856.1 ankyrin repeat protein [Gallaecimonas pentaromativorans]